MRWVLVVEDSGAVRSLIKTALEGMGDFSTVEARTGFEAMKLLPGRPFSLIITDINMPDINGLELISFVKGHPAYQEIPLVVVSTERSEEDQRRGLALGAAGYVVKPFRTEELQQVVRKVLDLHQ